MWSLYCELNLISLGKRVLLIFYLKLIHFKINSTLKMNDAFTKEITCCSKLFFIREPVTPSVAKLANAARR